MSGRLISSLRALPPLKLAAPVFRKPCQTRRQVCRSMWQASHWPLAAAAVGITLLVLQVVKFARADASLSLLSKANIPALSFRGKVVWLTGASQGLGAELADAFARAGAQLILSSRKAEPLQGIADALSSKHSTKCLVLPFDLCAANDVIEQKAQAADEALSGAGVDYLVHVAGASQHAVAEETTAEVVQALFRVNTLGPIMLTQAMLPRMLRRQKGRIVVVSSMAGKVPSPGQAVYSACKTALQGYFSSLNAEVSHRGVGVTLCCPGPIETQGGQPRVVFGAQGLVQHGGTGKPSRSRMRPERVAELVVKAAYYGLDDVCIARHPILLLAYVMRYLPALGMYVLKQVGPGRAAQLKAGGSGYDVAAMQKRS